MVSESTGKTFSTYMSGGDLVVLPATIKGIREALPPDQRAAFTEAVENAGAEELFELLATWAERTRPDLIADKEAAFGRIERGDFTGTVSAEDVAAFFGPAGESA
ncbi:hypothetical protein [Streptomyces yaizuensis]|uniref:Uncharacterized protein n=1 Tax=Streptomyces yaizuensis TaxID=2989713 RepID=A0ABQ5NXY3_9ACTN|nr:hypothetical protein [Streptomyces sp. YSPA8]GLF95230.1 hypothetical protein SYYSPA8_13055 [Streptomyces sp. YSPA8]